VLLEEREVDEDDDALTVGRLGVLRLIGWDFCSVFSDARIDATVARASASARAGVLACDEIWIVWPCAVALSRTALFFSEPVVIPFERVPPIELGEVTTAWTVSWLTGTLLRREILATTPGPVAYWAMSWALPLSATA
jgi:hypothetical protein